MRKTGWSILAPLVLAAACGSQVDSKVIEARKASCATYCDRKAECPGELPTEAFATRDECFRQCTEAGNSMDIRWGRAADSDKDMCFDEWVAQIECTARLTCEERKSLDYCEEEVLASSICSRPYRGGAK